MKFLMILSLYLSFFSLFLTHPMSLGFILLTQTMIISFIINFLNLNFWFSYILFLIMIGGLLILFIYMTSIASNEKFFFSNFLMLMFMTLILLIIIINLMDNYYMYINLSNYDIKLTNNKFNLFTSVNKFFNFPMNSIFYMTIMYLLITLIAVVKICNINMGPLRSKN